MAIAQADAVPGTQKPGLMSRIAGFFSPLDNDGAEVIIPSSTKPAADPADAAAATGSQTQQAPGASAAEPAPTGSSKLQVFYESPEDAPAPPPLAPAPAPVEPWKAPTP